MVRDGYQGRGSGCGGHTPAAPVLLYLHLTHGFGFCGGPGTVGHRTHSPPPTLYLPHEKSPEVLRGMWGLEQGVPRPAYPYHLATSPWSLVSTGKSSRKEGQMAPTMAGYPRRGPTPVITKQQKTVQKMSLLFHTQISRFMFKKVFLKRTGGQVPGEKPQSSPVCRRDADASATSRVFAPSPAQGRSPWGSPSAGPAGKALRLVTVLRRPAVRGPAQSWEGTSMLGGGRVGEWSP